MSYKKIDTFYKDFYLNLKKIFPQKEKELYLKYNEKYLINYKFYTKEDRKFRFCRDIILNTREYNVIAEKMMKAKKYRKKDRKKQLFMNISDIKEISEKGHTIGLHSHSHPTKIDKLDYKVQYKEYSKSKKILEKILKKKVWAMSHPCGNYNNNSLKILNKIGIKIGFRSNLSIKENASILEVPREDHTDILKKLK